MSANKQCRPPNYRKIFYMGILCVGMGVPLASPILLIVGAVLMIMGWMNRHKWPPRAWMTDKDWEKELERIKEDLQAKGPKKEDKDSRPSQPGDSI